MMRLAWSFSPSWGRSFSVPSDRFSGVEASTHSPDHLHSFRQAEIGGDTDRPGSRNLRSGHGSARNVGTANLVRLRER